MTTIAAALTAQYASRAMGNIRKAQEGIRAASQSSHMTPVILELLGEANACLNEAHAQVNLAIPGEAEDRTATLVIALEQCLRRAPMTGSLEAQVKAALAQV